MRDFKWDKLNKHVGCN